MDIGTSLLIALLGIVVVLIVLIVLIFLLYGFNVALEPVINFFGRLKRGIVSGFKKIFSRKKKLDLNSENILSDESGTDEELAAVMAAVNCYMAAQVTENGLDFVVKSIRRHV